jgi:hypothetical protein
MADDIRSNLGDPDNFAGLPWPASPVSSAGEDPDEARLLMGGATAPQTQEQAADRLMRQYGGSSGAAASPVLKPQASAVASPAPAAAPVTSPLRVGASAASSEAPPADWTSDDARQGTGMQLEAGRHLMQTGEAMQPDGSIPRMQQQVASDEAGAPNAQDYKPGFGTRLLRGLKGAALGAAEGGVFGAAAGALDPALVRGGTGYRAPTDAYDIALDANKKKTAADQQGLQNAMGNFKTAQDLRASQQTAFSDAAKAGAGAASGATNAADAVTKAAQLPIDQEKADADAQKALNVSQDGKLKTTQAEIDQRTRFADQQRMPPGANRTRYILTGAIEGAPTRAASEAEDNLNRLVTAFRHDHNGQGPATVGDWQGLIQAARGQQSRTDVSDPKAQAILADSVGRKNAFLMQWERQPDGNWTKHGVLYAGGQTKSPGDMMTGEQMRAKLDQFRVDSNTKLAALGVKMDDQGQVVPTTTSTPASASRGPAAPASASHPAPGTASTAQRVKVRIPDGKGGWRNATVPASNLDAAMARGARKAE